MKPSKLPRIGLRASLAATGTSLLVLASAGNVNAQDTHAVKIPNNSITTKKLANRSVTLAKLGSDVGVWRTAGSGVYAPGKVGIGTNLPQTLLQVGSFSNVGADSFITVATAGVNESNPPADRLAGIRLASFNKTFGFTIQSRDGVSSSGLEIINHGGALGGPPAMFIDRGSSNVGIGTAAPATRLHVSADGTGPGSPAGHVALIKDSTDSNTSILALQSDYNDNHEGTDNFITFFNSNGASIGSIEGNNAGSVQLSGAGSDYAEYLPKADPDASIKATEIVGVRDGKIVGRGAEADQYMIVTGQAIVAGNRPSENDEELAKHSLVSFIGQVPVQVRGPVKSGDFILSSEKGDGTGIAMSASDITPSAMTRVVGRAWQASDEEGLKNVNTAVGLDQTSLIVPALQRLERENQELRERLQKLETLTMGQSAPAGVALGE